MSFIADLRHAARLLGKSPVFTVTSILSLARGIGAAAAIFSLTDALLFEPTAGVRNASEVVDIGRANQGSGFDNMSHPAYRYLREHSRTVAIAAVDFGGGPLRLKQGGMVAASGGVVTGTARRNDRSRHGAAGGIIVTCRRSPRRS